MPEANIFEQAYNNIKIDFNLYIVGAATNINFFEELKWMEDVNNTRYSLTTEEELGHLSEFFLFENIVGQSNFLFIGRDNKVIGKLDYLATLEEMENMFYRTLASFEGVRQSKPIENIILDNNVAQLDLDYYFYIEEKNNVEFELISNSNPSILSAYVLDKSLVLNKGNSTGNSKIVIQTKIPDKNIAFNTEFFVFNSNGESEDFEYTSLTESSIPWETSEEWIISDETSYTGDLSLRSNDTRKTTLSITLNILEQDHISFAYKTFTKDDNSVLTFYIDSVAANGRDPISLWSGENDWRIVTYDVEPGIKTFTWEYASSDIIPDGNSYVWVDAIMLPESVYTPANLAISTNTTNVRLDWETVSGALLYRVYYSDDPYKDFSLWSYEETTDLFWDIAIPATKRFYQVTAVSSKK